MRVSTSAASESTEVGDNRSKQDTRWQVRLMIVAAAILAALIVWLVARVGFGLDVRSPTFSGQHFAIGPLLVLVTAAIFSLLRWGLLAILERVTAHGRVVWLVVAILGLALSLGAPLSGTGVTAGDRIALVLMHLAAGAVLIVGLARTVRSRP